MGCKSPRNGSMATSYRALASEVGCLSAEIYKEIRRCLRLRGGVMHDGIKWIWKTSEELAERLGCHEKTIRRHLKALVDMGWLQREQLQKRWGKRAYHYCLGDNAPLKPAPVEHLHGMQGHKRAAVSSPAQMPVQTRRLRVVEPEKMSASYEQEHHSQEHTSSPEQPQQPAASRLTEQREGWIRTLCAGSTDRGIRSIGTATKAADQKRCDLFLEPALAFKTRAEDGQTTSSLEPETNGTTTAVPSHWPVDDMSLSRKLQVIEAAKQLAFPNRASQAYGFA